MDFFMKEENVNKYIEMTEEYDGGWVVEKLKKYLPEGSSLLELGMGPGKDLEMLAKHYEVVGSDNSEVFVNRYKEKNSDIEVAIVDAINMDIDRKFDCIYSNKVLHHLKKSDFIKSLKNQLNVLNDEGIIFMTLWRGEYKEEVIHNGEIRFTYYLEKDIKDIVKNMYEVVDIEIYTEFEESKDDSIIVVLKKK